MTALLAGRTAVITGGSRGFGLAIARAFVAQGANVVICATDETRLDAAVADLELAAPGRVHGHPCDTADLTQVRRLAEVAVARFGGIDVWVNNAGISGPYGEVEYVPPEVFKRVVRTNVVGVYHGTLVALEHLGPNGKLINVAGLGADGRPAPRQVAYSASKAWVQSFTRSVAAERRDSRVGVFVLNPGMMLTDMVTRVECASDTSAVHLERFPLVLEILGQPPEIPARRAVWLASRATDGRTGLVVRELSGLKPLALLAAYAWRRISGKKKDLRGFSVTRTDTDPPANDGRARDRGVP